MPARATPIRVIRDGPRRYHSLIDRQDGVTVRLEGGSYNKVGGDARGVPHDIAHFLVEDAFGLPGGLWGVLAAGGTVQNAAIVDGRRPPHAAQRARAITDAASRTLWETEVVVRAVADLARSDASSDVGALAAACGGERWPAGAVTPERLDQLRAALRAAAADWWALEAGSPYRLSWRLPPPG